MKLNVEVEIEWIDEEGSVDEQVKREMIHQISNNIKRDALQNIKERTEKKIISTVDKAVEKQSEAVVKNFMRKKFNVYNNYGDITETDVSIIKRVKKGLEEYWHELVNSNGKKKDRYGDGGPYKKRVEWYIDNKIEKQSKEFASTLTTDTENKIKQSMKKNLAETIGAKLVGELGLDKLLIESKE